VRTLKRNKKEIFLASRDLTETEYMKFSEAISIEINFAIANSEQDLVAFGENYVNIARSNATPEQLLLFKETDRVFLTEPSVYDQLADGADYRVKSVIDSINNTQIVYEKMSDA